MSLLIALSHNTILCAPRFSRTPNLCAPNTSRPHVALTFLAFRKRDLRSEGSEGVPMRKESWKLGQMAENTIAETSGQEYIDRPALRTGLEPSLQSRTAASRAEIHLCTRPLRPQIPRISQLVLGPLMRDIGKRRNIVVAN